MVDPLLIQRAMQRVAEERIREAQEKGAFDNLPGRGKPIPDLDAPFDELWWVKRAGSVASASPATSSASSCARPATSKRMPRPARPRSMPRRATPRAE